MHGYTQYELNGDEMMNRITRNQLVAGFESYAIIGIFGSCMGIHIMNLKAMK